MVEGLDEPKEVVSCVYIEAFGNHQAINRTMVDSGAVVELISPDLIRSLGLKALPMEHKWSLKLANDVLVPIKHYVVLGVVVSGIRARICAYVMGINETYDLLLSKNWMKRVQAVEHHGNDSMVIQGKNGHQAQVSAVQVV